MDISFADLKEKEIINVFDGKKLGRIVDILFDGSSGVVRGIVVPGERKLFRRNEDIFVSLERIRKIGDDVILVSLPVQNQVGLQNQIANSYGIQRMPSRSLNQTQRVSGKLGEGYFKDNQYNIDGGNKISFVRYKRIDNKKYKWLAK